ncbi:serine/threonine-protein kinase Kist-like [Dendronephthya gigantea]|uniref:serine/threonine-protein kinase Kist-like n=1 Tax=Dendronephthya gigantea TaxID=151771 RepID=UPI00106C7341|nr:serine/threonine-protein kinase Kist-like [Dendronephthya gigantea]
MDLLGCSLKDLLIKHQSTRFSLFLVKKIIHDLLSAAMFLEEMGIVHGDIKPSNILWNMNTECFQLIDFSVSFKLRLSNRVQQPLQSMGYQAPEVVEWNKVMKGATVSNEQDLDSSVDIWSIGCVLVYVTTGQPLYSNEHASQLPRLCTNCELKCSPCVHALKSTEIITSIRNELPIHERNILTHIISGFLQCHSYNRLSPAYVLNHPFLLTSPSPDASITDLLLLPTRVLRLLNMFNETKSEVIEDILLDIREECERFGEVVLVKTSKVNSDGYNVYVEYQKAEDCCEAQHLLTGRYFDNKFVVATFLPLQHFRENRFY